MSLRSIWHALDATYWTLSCNTLLMLCTEQHFQGSAWRSKHLRGEKKFENEGVNSYPLWNFCRKAKNHKIPVNSQATPKKKTSENGTPKSYEINIKTFSWRCGEMMSGKTQRSFREREYPSGGMFMFRCAKWFTVYLFICFFGCI